MHVLLAKPQMQGFATHPAARLTQHAAPTASAITPSTSMTTRGAAGRLVVSLLLAAWCLVAGAVCERARRAGATAAATLGAACSSKGRSSVVLRRRQH